jgi:uncharacterized damage-inducible protein DinB
MTEQELELLKYPVGKFVKPVHLTPEDHAKHIASIKRLPADLTAAVAGLSDAQLDTPYRPGGWSLRQVVHHLADSHINSFVRFKLALTEESPTIKPYLEGRWATTPDASSMPLQPGIELLSGLHARWVVLLQSLGEPEYKRTFYHPERKITITLGETLALYAWHCTHHLAHITTLRKLKGW